MKKLVFVLSIAAMFVISCSKDAAGPSYSTTAATGKVAGSAFVVKGATVTSSTYSTNSTFYLYADTLTSLCYSNSDLYVYFSIPNKVGTYSLKTPTLTNLVTYYAIFVNYSSSYASKTAYSGSIEIQSVTATEVKGRLNVTGDASNTLNGTFTAKVCQ